jgi:DNA modification methylase
MFFALSNYTRIQMTVENSWKLKDDYGKYSPNPLIWVKPSNDNPRPYERFTVNYEPFFFCWKGNTGSKLGNEINSPSNSTFAFNYKGANKLHPAEKPEELYERLISLSSVPGATVLDPFLGSGVSLAVAKRMGRKIIGIEQVESWYNIAKHKIYNFDEESTDATKNGESHD